MFKIVVFAPDIKSFNLKKNELQIFGISSDQVYFANSSIQTRLDLINNNLNTWLLFIDLDCSFGPEIFEVVSKIISQPDFGNRVFAGVYKNPVISNSIQRTHNFIANTWLRQSYDTNAEKKLILGGVFLIFSKFKITHEASDIFWGAEDKLLAYKLADADFIFKLREDLFVEHHTNSTFLHFLRRAFLHGTNEVKKIENNYNTVNYLYWIRKIDFADLRLVALIVLHFSVQKAAKLFQTVRRLNKS